MKFRKIYWVTEQLGSDHSSKVCGVFTSIHDLTAKGVQWMDGCDLRDGFRLNLVQLDSDKTPLGCWRSPDFSGLESDLQDYVKTDEMNAQDVEQMCSELRAFFR
ncbi:MAG: hypothetical protein JST30_01855 [Armatimonadetes bacterium]|nr:hypothetical protein [Armatimonadota bacterium]